MRLASARRASWTTRPSKDRILRKTCRTKARFGGPSTFGDAAWQAHLHLRRAGASHEEDRRYRRSPSSSEGTTRREGDPGQAADWATSSPCNGRGRTCASSVAAIWLRRMATRRRRRRRSRRLPAASPFGTDRCSPNLGNRNCDTRRCSTTPPQAYIRLLDATGDATRPRCLQRFVACEPRRRGRSAVSVYRCISPVCGFRTRT